MSSDHPSLTPGQKLGRYDLLAPIARGGSGQIWVARLRGARGFHKLVSIKTLLCARAEEQRMEHLLLEEARIASLIQHSNVVQTLELGEHEGALYLVMEWVDGEPLSEVLAAAKRCGGIPFLVAVNLIGQTLRGLQAAHELCDELSGPLGVMHGNVSQDNVLVTYSGVAKLADFGIVQAERRPSHRAEPGEIQGKFPCLAPEQLMGGLVDQRTDLFAVGILLYLLTTGRHPFKENAAEGVRQSLLSAEPVIRPSLLKSTYSRTLEAVVMKALDKDRERRWPSAEEMRLALERGVPQAFSLGFESQMRGFMSDAVGDRAVAKREALRRAELVADARLNQSALHAEAGATPSAGSLRAILIDQEMPREEPPARERTQPRRPLAPPPPPERRGRTRWPIVAIAVTVGAALFAVFASRSPSAAPSSAAAPGYGMVEFALPRLVPTTTVRATASSASASAVPSPSPSASASFTRATSVSAKTLNSSK